MNVFMLGENLHKYWTLRELFEEVSQDKYKITNHRWPTIKSRVRLLELLNNGGRNLHSLGGEDNYDDVFVVRVFSLQT